MTRLLLLLAVTFTIAADWPRFRGPNGTGITDASPVSWTKDTKPLWKVELPGKGNGSPIVAAGKVFVQTAKGDGSNRAIVAYDFDTGKHLWTKTYSGTTAKIHQKNSLASNTPACDGERVYCCFWDGKDIELVALTIDGKELWKAKLGGYVSQHGAGMSPIVHEGKVIVNYDQDGAAALVAYDAKTGKEAWNKSRKAYRACYSTPMVRELSGGKTEVINFSTAGVTGYDPASGDVNWDHTISWGKGPPLRSIASPVLIGEMIITTTGDGSGDRYCAAVTPGKDPKVVWQQKSAKLAPYVPCPIALGKHLYWVTDQGIVECINPLTGKAVWSERIFNSSVSASPILLGDVMLMIDERGKAIACKLNEKEYEKVAESDVGEPVFATPAAANGRLILRTSGGLICYGK
ncbi:PQQ-like beta-propeller repeat protein [soil metagenome]